MLAHPSSLLSTVLIGNIIVNVAASVTGLAIATQFYPAYAEIVSIFAMTLILLIFGEITPKRFALLKPEFTAILYTPCLTRLIKILAPIRFLLESTGKIFKHALMPYGRILNEDEFRTLIAISGEGGILSSDEHEIVDGIIRLESIRASDVMTPRVDIAGLDINDNPAVWQAGIKKTAYRYLIAYREHLDNIEGVLDVRNYLLNSGRDLYKALLPPFFVPESARLNSILEEFQKSNRNIAIVVDEYGGIAGLLTIGDILEEVIDIGDDTNHGVQTHLEKIAEDKWLVDGSTSIEEINNELDIEMETEDADRIAGWIIEQAKHMPQIGETVAAGNIRASVKEIRKKRITRVLLEIMEEDEEQNQ